MRHSCSGKVGRTGLQRVRHFQGKCLRTPIPVSFHTPKITKIIHRGICSSCLTVIYQDACLVASAPALKSHTRWSPPLPFHFFKLFFLSIIDWTARRSSQSILKEVSPEYSLEILMLKLKLQYFGHLMQRTDSFEKTLMLGKIEGGRRSGRQRMRWLDASPTQWT